MFLDNEGNTKVSLENGRAVVYYNGNRLELFHYIHSYDNGKKSHTTRSVTNEKFYGEAPYFLSLNSSNTLIAEVINGEGILVLTMNGFSYPEKYLDETPLNGPPSYYAWGFDIQTGAFTFTYGIDASRNLAKGEIHAGFQETIISSLWAAPSDETTGSYLDFRKLFKNVLEPNSSEDLTIKTYSGNFRDYKFYNRGSEKYEIKTDSGFDEITGMTLEFSDKAIDAVADIKGVFDQITGLNTDSGKMFRLYNAAFARFPDADGLKYWIGNFSSGKDDERAVASSFIASSEFKERYGENVSNSMYIETLYINVLGRDYDQSGYNYWLGNLNNGLETRYELLLGFAESTENQALFSEMTGFV